jgi:hypothetical protein
VLKCMKMDLGGEERAAASNMMFVQSFMTVCQLVQKLLFGMDTWADVFTDMIFCNY